MKKIFFIQDTAENRITYYHLLAFVMTLPLDRLYSELALISLCVHTCIHLKKKNLVKINAWVVCILSAVYLLTILGTAYTRYYDEAFYEWERQLALVLFPLVCQVNAIDLRKYYLNIVLAMAVGCAIAILYLYCKAFGIIILLHLPVSAIFSTAFINHNFSAPIDMHATYFSMYIALSAVAAGYYLSKTNSRIDRLTWGCILLLLAVALVQLSSRSVLIAFAVIVNIFFPVFLFKKRNWLKGFLISLLCSISIFLLILQADTLKGRFITGLKDDLTQNSFEPRVQRWKLAWELINTSPVYGHGSGSEIALLNEAYFREKLYNSYLNQLNAHNQYLSIAVKTGGVGLLVFLLMLLYGIRIAFYDRNLLFIGFLVVSCMVFFSENVLDANKGIFFFAFYFTLFCTTGKKVLFKNKIVAV
jgi:O-antigen ligase